MHRTGQGVMDNDIRCGGQLADVLDNPAWHALVGAQRPFGRVTALAGSFRSDVAPFGALSDDVSAASWVHLAELVGPMGTVSLTGDPPDPPTGWTVIERMAAVQMVLEGGVVPGPTDDLVTGRTDGTHTVEVDGVGDIEPLGPDDVPAMLRLVELAQPGPFRANTVRFGGYLGIRHQGQLVAMGGQRLRPPGHTEISAVSTDPAYRQRGLAGHLVRALTAAIVDRGEVPFLHASSTNVDAIRLYQSLGFAVRKPVVFLLLEAPG
jgi:ribosomal protein S18 acetylase RimI-like enzyme